MGASKILKYKLGQFLGAAFLLLGLGFLFNPALAEDVPDDFQVVFTSRPAMVGEDIEIEILTLNSAGETQISPQGHYRGTFPDISFEELPAQTLTLSQEAVGEIYGAVTANDFFSLDPEYADPGIMDGDLATLTITANGQTHSVTTRNIKVRAFDRITVTINSFLPDERRLLYNAINGADYEEVER